MDRTKVDISKLGEYQGQSLTSKQIKEICCYSPSTFIKDTSLYKEDLIERQLGYWPHLYKVVKRDWTIRRS